MLSIGLAAASFIGATRIIAGDHFPTDVLAGAAVGTSMGLLIPAVHRWPVAVTASGQSVALLAAF